MASSKVIWVIVKKETMRVQNAMAFLFMSVSKNDLEIFCTLQEDPNISHYRQRRTYILKSLQLLPLRKEASTNYLLQVLGKTHTHTHTHTTNRTQLLSLPGNGIQSKQTLPFFDGTASEQKCNIAGILGKTRCT